MTEEFSKEPSALENNIIKAITSKKIFMRPKWHFVLKIILLIVGTVLVALTTLFLASFIVFSLRQSGAWFMPGFGTYGLMKFISSLPWILIAVALIFILTLGALIKKYSFSYGKPLLYSALGIIAFAVLGGFFIALTPFHANLLERAEQERLPIGRKMYERMGGPQIPGAIRGEIIKISPDIIIINSDQGAEIIISVDENTKMPKRQLKVTDDIIALGEETENFFKAIGIELLSGRRGFKPFDPPRLNRPF